jgi:Domain of unknown function (DUF1996).
MIYPIIICSDNGPELTRIQNSFNASMPYPQHDPAEKSTCTSCQFAEDLSNYWTAVLFFRARNGTFKRVPQLAQFDMQGQNGGMVSPPSGSC